MLLFNWFIRAYTIRRIKHGFRSGTAAEFAKAPAQLAVIKRQVQNKCSYYSCTIIEI